MPDIAINAKWVVAPGDAAAESALVDQLGVTPLQARLLVNRGVLDPVEAKKFIEPSGRHHPSPFAFRDMEKAVDRILAAAAKKEKVFIFGDRDVDGVSGTAILLRTLRAFGLNPGFHIPAGGEGYGVHPDTIKRALAEGYTLGITVDTGVAEIDRVAEANAGGMDVIIADHHQAKATLPAAYAILHPLIDGESYPFKYLSGAGVAFKLALALFESKSEWYKKPVIVADVETTGLTPGTDDVIEIGAVKCRNGVPYAEFSRLINIGKPLPREIVKITGITDELLAAEGVSPEKAFREFAEFVAEPDAILAAYNVEFDNAFLSNGLKKYASVDPTWRTLDVLELARISGPVSTSKRLGAVAEAMGVELSGAHRAMADVRATVEIMNLLTEKTLIERQMFYEKLLPLAALAAVADMMPLTGENRVIVKRGIESMARPEGFMAGLLRSDPLVPGLRALLEHLKLARPVSKDLGFTLCPILNAPGRLGDSGPALKLLAAETRKEGQSVCAELVGLNDRRKALVIENVDALAPLAEQQNDLENDKVICIRAEGIAHGVTGIVCSRLVNQYNRPVVVILVEDDMGVGTSRSIAGFNLLDPINDCGDLLDKFGGHHAAVGITLRAENIDEFFRRVKEAVAKRLTEVPEARVDIDAKLELSDLTLKTLDEIALLEPYGKGNPAPLFALYNAPVLEARRIGADGTHLRLRIGSGRDAITAVNWGAGDLADQIRSGAGGTPIDIVFEMSNNEWKGRSSLQLMIQDIKIRE